MKPQKLLMDTIIIFGVLYVVLAPRIALPLYNGMIFYPHKYPIGDYGIRDIDGIKLEDVCFSSENGKKLHGWFFQKDDTSPLVIISHGNAGNISYRIPLCYILLKAGASVLVYDYQGYGRSEGRPSLDGICKDGLAAHDYMVEKKGIDPDRIIHLGESLGSAVACHVSKERTFKALILQSGFSSFKKIAKQALPYLFLYPSAAFPDIKLDNIAVLKEPHPPVLFIHGARDTIVPYSHSKEMFVESMQPKEFATIDGAGHNDIYTDYAPEYMEAIDSFMSRLSGSQKSGESA